MEPSQGTILEKGEISLRAVEGGLKSFPKDSAPIGIVTSSSLVKLSNRRIPLEARRNWFIDKPHLRETIVFSSRRKTLLLLSKVTSSSSHTSFQQRIEDILHFT
jgi:hypothetical protein